MRTIMASAVNHVCEMLETRAADRAAYDRLRCAVRLRMLRSGASAGPRRSDNRLPGIPVGGADVARDRSSTSAFNDAL